MDETLKEPRFADYNLKQLRDVLVHIDDAVYPDRAAEVEKLIAVREVEEAESRKNTPPPPIPYRFPVKERSFIWAYIVFFATAVIFLVMKSRPAEDGATINMAAVGALALFVGAGTLLIAALIRFNYGRASRNWPTAPGKVVHVSEMPTVRDRWWRMIDTPQIHFAYEAGGASRRSRFIAWGMKDLMRPRRARKLLESYPLETAVTVYHHPDKPDFGVLKPGAGGKAIRGIVIGAVGLLASMFLLFGPS